VKIGLREEGSGSEEKEEKCGRETFLFGESGGEHVSFGKKRAVELKTKHRKG